LLNGAIDDSVASSVVAQLLWLESDSAEKPVTLYINSPGGSISSGSRSPIHRRRAVELMNVFAGLAIYDTMTYIRCPVSTVCLGAASSMAALLLTGGEAGKRYALPHSSIMVHQPLGGTQGQATDILIYAEQIQRIRDQVNELYRRHLNTALGFEKYGIKDIHLMMERDKYMTAKEAKEHGIIDEILTTRADRENEEKKAAETNAPKA